MRLTTQQMQEAVEFLQGSCNTIDGTLGLLFDIEQSDLKNEMEFCDFLDERLFECADCGWWCESGDWIDYEDNPNPGNGDICTDCGSAYVKED